MNLIEAIKFPFQDENWIMKLGMGIIMLFIPVIGWLILFGYGIRLNRNVQSNAHTLPEFDDYGGDLTRGFMAFLGSVVYLLPSLCLGCCIAIIGNGDNGLNLVGCLLSLISIGYGLLITPLLYSGTARYAMTENIGVYFQIGQHINDVVGNPGDTAFLYANIIALTMAMGMLIPLGLLACCIPGLVATLTYVLASNHLAGQWGRLIVRGQYH